MNNSDAIGLLGLSVGVLSIIVTLWIFYAKINKSLDVLLGRRQQTLRKAEGEAVLGLYVDSTRLVLEETVRNLVKHIPPGPDDAYAIKARAAIKIATSRVLSSQRERLATMLLAGGLSLKSFVDDKNPSDSGPIGAAVRRLENLITNSLAEAKAAGELSESARKKIEAQANDIFSDAFKKSHAELLEQLKKHYSDRSG